MPPNYSYISIDHGWSFLIDRLHCFHIYYGTNKLLFIVQEYQFTWYHYSSLTSSYKHSTVPERQPLRWPSPARSLLPWQWPTQLLPHQKMQSVRAMCLGGWVWVTWWHSKIFYYYWTIYTDPLDKTVHWLQWWVLSESIAELCCGSWEQFWCLRGGILLDIQHHSWLYKRADCWQWSYSSTNTDRAELHVFAEQWIVISFLLYLPPKELVSMQLIVIKL